MQQTLLNVDAINNNLGLLTHNKKRIVITPLPIGICILKGISILQDDCYIIGIDQSLPEDEYKRVLGHELAHVFLNHLDNLKPGDRSTADQELEADQRAMEYYKLYNDAIQIEMVKGASYT